MKDTWINIGYEECPLRPFFEPDIDYNDQSKIGNFTAIHDSWRRENYFHRCPSQYGFYTPANHRLFATETIRQYYCYLSTLGDWYAEAIIETQQQYFSRADLYEQQATGQLFSSVIVDNDDSNDSRNVITSQDSSIWWVYHLISFCLHFIFFW